LILSTPYVDMKLEKAKNSPTGLKGVCGIENVEHLIHTLKTEYPEIYGQMKKFSLRRYDCRHGATWSRI
jgi:hypothetical protein